MIPVNRRGTQPRAGMEYFDARRKPHNLGKVVVALVLTTLCIFVLKQSPVFGGTSMFSRHEPGVTHVLVTGGAGYIGSHASLRLLKDNYRVTIVDNLSRGNKGAVKVLQELFPEPGRLQFIYADLGDQKLVNKIFSENAFDAVMHFAAVAYVGESTLEPLRYYHNITSNTLLILEAMASHGVKTLIYSSTCATYGEPEKMPIIETTPQLPINPYGKAKKMAEDIILDFSKRTDMAVMILRYFNVIGSDPEGRLGEAPRPELREHGRISGACFDAALGILPGLKVKGTDYPTADGTCIRDYIDVTDLVDAHVKALDKAEPSKVSIYNVGTGRGRSVKEFVDACKQATGVDIKVEYLSRRPGDYAEVFSDPTKINNELNWTAQHTNLKESLSPKTKPERSHQSKPTRATARDRYIMATPTTASSSTPPKPPNAAMLQPAPYLPDMAAPNSNSSVSSASSSSTASIAGRSSTFSVDSAVATPTSSPPRPHRAGDLAWEAIRAAAAPLGPRDFTLVRRVGAGDIGTVYLCRLEAEGNQSCAYAMKVVDRRALAKKGKLGRAAAEKRVLRRLDHPFLPTMFADFDAGTDYSCIVMEFCPGGDLHSLRHRMPGRRFPLASARFYAAEVLLALEYLHMMGIVYRDLKPENVLIRGDGHIMLTDFDLSLESTASPSIEEARNVDGDDDGDDATAASIPTCFPEVQLLRLMKWRRRAAPPRPRPRPRFVAEPVDARSSSFVGTHEYVAPEVASGGGHGASVDWWAYGVFLYELLYGRTPFVGATNEATLRNIVRAPLECPPLPAGTASHGDAAAARDLIARLLDKDPKARLGSRRGAADVKAHPFFRGLNFALLRSSAPPVVPPRAALHQQCGKASPDVHNLFDQF